jgi:ubiquinone/menaquinone biosynthesis C-methylase UbiE
MIGRIAPLTSARVGLTAWNLSYRAFSSSDNVCRTSTRVFGTIAESPLASTSANRDKKDVQKWDHSMVPAYLDETYWWAYTRPWAIQIFERKWLVNSILWGNFGLLRDAALQEITVLRESRDKSQPLSVLQIACVYGEFSEKVLSLMRPQDSFHIVDVAPSQLENVSRKLKLDDQDIYMAGPDVKLWQQDSSNMCRLADESMDCIFLFFLLHEQPEEVRRKTLKEALRLLKPVTGKLVIVDYHKPRSPFNPFRYIMALVFRLLEPFAMDLWRHPVTHFMEQNVKVISYEQYFGGLYQKLIIEKK